VSFYFANPICEVLDICFDEALFAGLTSVLRHLVVKCAARAYIMCTMRNAATFSAFMTRVRDEDDLHVVEHAFEWPERALFAYHVDKRLPMVCVEISHKIA